MTFFPIICSNTLRSACTVQMVPLIVTLRIVVQRWGLVEQPKGSEWLVWAASLSPLPFFTADDTTECKVLPIGDPILHTMPTGL